MSSAALVVWLVAQVVTIGVFPPGTVTPSGAPLATLPPVTLTCDQTNEAALSSVVLSSSLAKVSFAIDDPTNAGKMCSSPDLSAAYQALTVVQACTQAPCPVYPVFWQTAGGAWNPVTPGVQMVLTASAPPPPVTCRQVFQVLINGRWTTEYLDQPAAACAAVHR